ncbi:MAG TPA: hypothetical protein VJ111_02125 [Chitinophagaceae bacterium]|nr:hypothetical protein [Chitinophagaceae bacterium]
MGIVAGLRRGVIIYFWVLRFAAIILNITHLKSNSHAATQWRNVEKLLRMSVVAALRRGVII